MGKKAEFWCERFWQAWREKNEAQRVAAAATWAAQQAAARALVRERRMNKHARDLETANSQMLAMGAFNKPDHREWEEGYEAGKRDGLAFPNTLRRHHYRHGPRSG